ncbi:hypothetical protein FPZ12_034560 [Amycolatopsis acidicola]|uniref:Transmembrane protein n=1 Tax=Amycolatopsis acidicola TaxID=2596893 RepID=A0A5N0URL1_9PSEU|nr:hypothetical protein [Amycolatopsis acidicola]KAA9153466.1 hypothetical protein FPZ12_034560 [Amycolatopsis acidicola]
MDGRRWWRLAHAGRNPLVRRGDRVETALLLFFVLLALAALPVAWTMGAKSFDAQQAVVLQARADRHPAEAVLLADAAPDIVSPEGMPVHAKTSVEAAWRLPDGSDRTGTVLAERGTTAGTTVPIWLDDSGNPVAAPPGRASPLIVGVTTAALCWLAFTGFLTGVFCLVRYFDDRRRYARWEREWPRSPADSGK